MPDLLDLFSTPPPAGAEASAKMLDDLLNNVLEQAGQMMVEQAGEAVESQSFEGLYGKGDLLAEVADSSGWLADYAEVQRNQTPPTLPPASEFSQEKLSARPALAWLADIEAVLVQPHSTDPEEQLDQLRGVTEQLRLEARALPANLFPRRPDFVPPPCIAIDTETTGLDTRVRYGQDGKLIPGLRLVSVIVAPSDIKAYYLPVMHTGEDGVSNWDNYAITTWVGELLAEFLCVFHRAEYDLEVLALNGTPISRGFPYILDTQILSYLFDINQTQHGLKVVSPRYIQRKMLEIGELFVGVGGIKKNAYIAFDTLSATQAVVYGASDGLNTMGLLWFFANQTGTANVFQTQALSLSVDMNLIDTLRNMLRTGLPINYQYLFFAAKDAIYRRILLQEDINRLAGKTINIGSGPQLRALLFDDLKLAPLPQMKVGKAGDLSLDENALIALHRAYPEVEALTQIVRYRKLTDNIAKLYIKMLTNCWTDAHLPWLRVKLGFTQTGTVTGRLASSGSKDRHRVRVRAGAKKLLYTLIKGGWEAGINAQGVNASPFRTAPARRLKALPAAAGLNLDNPYPPEVEAALLRACAQL